MSLLGRFCDKATRQSKDLEEAFLAKDFIAFREIAHSLKGASWNLSARRLGDAALSAENAGRNGDAEAAEEALREVTRAVEEFCRAAAGYIE